jgi:hypothetical protein
MEVGLCMITGDKKYLDQYRRVPWEPNQDGELSKASRSGMVVGSMLQPGVLLPTALGLRASVTSVSIQSPE